MLTFQQAEMRDICKGVVAALDQHGDFAKIKIMIMGGTNNFDMKSHTIGGKMPMTYLKKNWNKVKNQVLNSVFEPLQEYARTRILLIS